MSLLAIRVLARGVVLDALRRKDLWVIAIVGVLILSGSSALGIFGVDGLEVFIKDLAVTVVGLFSTIAAVLTACRVLPDEIRNRTLYPLLARPISRMDLLVGKFAGAVVVSWIGFLLLAALTGIAIFFLRVSFEPVMLQYLLAKMMGLAVICAIGLGLSTCMTPNAAATLTFLLAFGSPMFARALQMAYQSQPGLGGVFQLINAILPQVHLFDMGGRAVYLHWSPVPAWVLLGLAAYMAVYTAAVLGLSWLRFRRQAL